MVCYWGWVFCNPPFWTLRRPWGRSCRPFGTSRDLIFIRYLSFNLNYCSGKEDDIFFYGLSVTKNNWVVAFLSWQLSQGNSLVVMQPRPQGASVFKMLYCVTTGKRLLEIVRLGGLFIWTNIFRDYIYKPGWGGKHGGGFIVKGNNTTAGSAGLNVLSHQPSDLTYNALTTKPRDFRMSNVFIRV